VRAKRKSFGNTYALQHQTNDRRELAKLLMKLCEKIGRRPASHVGGWYGLPLGQGGNHRRMEQAKGLRFGRD